jgi:hypothetical protein
MNLAAASSAARIYGAMIVTHSSAALHQANKNGDAADDTLPTTTVLPKIMPATFNFLARRRSGQRRLSDDARGPSSASFPPGNARPWQHAAGIPQMAIHRQPGVL